MTPQSSSDVIQFMALLFIGGAVATACFVALRSFWWRSKNRRAQRLSEMSDVFRAVTDRMHRPGNLSSR